MITKEQIARINELAAIKKERDLTEAEAAEREELKKIYVAAFRESLTRTLENTYIIDEKGNKVAVKDRKKPDGH